MGRGILRKICARFDRYVSIKSHTMWWAPMRDAAKTNFGSPVGHIAQSQRCLARCTTPGAAHERTQRDLKGAIWKS